MRYPLSRDEAASLVNASLLMDGCPSRLPVWQSCLTPGTQPQEAVLAIGAFDGVHRGHRALIAKARADAERRGVPCLAVTFDPDPSELLDCDPQPRLLSVADRVQGLRALGVRNVVVLPFTRELANTEPEAFISDVLCALARPVAIHVGSNFRFGVRGAGTTALLRQLGPTYGFEVEESPLLVAGGERISSTRIRTFLGEGGRLDEANQLLGRCHFVRGSVEHGRGEGTSFGFPTANVRCAELSCMPAEGVYGGYLRINGRVWPAAINVGAPKSFTDERMERFLEANLIGFEGDVYGAAAEVIFVSWLRPSRPFASLEELERVVLGNIDWVRTNLGDGEVG